MLGQRKVDGKSNEIAAIPELLEMLDLKGSIIITIDAMGTQMDIAATIIDNNVNYILALKGNQGCLKEIVEGLCKRMKPDSENEVVEKGHGRIETIFTLSAFCKFYSLKKCTEELKPESAKCTSKFNCLKIWKTGKDSSRWLKSLLPEKSTTRKLSRYTSISAVYPAMPKNSTNTYVFTGASRTVYIGL